MNNTLGIIFEIIILIFNLLIFMQLTILKKDKPSTRLRMYVGTAIMIASFFYCTFILKMPEALSSFRCVTIPSSTLFFLLSKYKDMRFFVTFCFLDTLTLVLTFLARASELLWGKAYGILAYIALCTMMCAVYIKCKPSFHRYRELMDNVKDGWGSMAVATALIYALLIFTASYPEPLAVRPEYLPAYTLLSVTIVSFYVVFVLSLLQKKKLYDLNVRLQREQQWHQIAYVDALTGMSNRMAYIEKINELERTAQKPDGIYALMIDVDNFKRINDTLGHHVGDITLKKASEYLNKVFEEDNYQLFRVGGDEFAVIAVGVNDKIVEEKLKYFIDDSYREEVGCTFSVGYSIVAHTQKNSIENAFIRADSSMYEMKQQKKGAVK